MLRDRSLFEGVRMNPYILQIVMAQLAADPRMSDAELEARLRDAQRNPFRSGQPAVPENTGRGIAFSSTEPVSPVCSVGLAGSDFGGSER